MPILIFLVALLAGAFTPWQSGSNAQLNKSLSAPLWTAVVIYTSGLAGLLVAQLFVREPLPFARIHDVPWWAWLGGLFSLVSTIIGLTLAQRMGSTFFTGTAVTASLVVSVLLDHFGLLGFKQHTASPLRLAGCAIMVIGLWLIAKF